MHGMQVQCLQGENEQLKDLKQHLEQKHSKKSKRQSCSECSYRTDRKNDLVKHIKNKNKGALGGSDHQSREKQRHHDNRKNERRSLEDRPSPPKVQRTFSYAIVIEDLLSSPVTQLNQPANPRSPSCFPIARQTSSPKVIPWETSGRLSPDQRLFRPSFSADPETKTPKEVTKIHTKSKVFAFRRNNVCVEGGANNRRQTVSGYHGNSTGRIWSLQSCSLRRVPEIRLKMSKREEKSKGFRTRMSMDGRVTIKCATCSHFCPERACNENALCPQCRPYTRREACSICVTFTQANWKETEARMEAKRQRLQLRLDNIPHTSPTPEPDQPLRIPRFKTNLG
ncbi:hypothetical protein BSL78_15183 [Apostichopus japonicus]|uniref:Uncharacterized protein n=1 Tax=Stichopus japonicus TaxID=307972 RepID=A0A2G8KJ24_STIJA|nr:hypothetical protein BSL78_15183 [Apostichopus japonicus]